MDEFKDAEDFLRESIRNLRLQNSLDEIRGSVHNIWNFDALDIKNKFSYQGFDHIKRLICYIPFLLKSGHDQKLSEQETYIFFLSAYLHNIGMQCDVIKYKNIIKTAEKLGADFHIISRKSTAYDTPELIDIINNYNFLTAAWIHYAYRRKESRLGSTIQTVPIDLIEDLIDVCKYHNHLSIQDCPVNFKLDLNHRKQFLAALLHLSRELDIEAKQNSIETIKKFSSDSRDMVFWWLHNNAKINLKKPHEIIIMISMHPEDVNRYGSIVSDLFISEFEKKNRTALKVLIKNGLSIDISSEVIEHELIELLPQEIQKILHSLQIESREPTNLAINPKLYDILYRKEIIINKNLSIYSSLHQDENTLGEYLQQLLQIENIYSMSLQKAGNTACLSNISSSFTNLSHAVGTWLLGQIALRRLKINNNNNLYSWLKESNDINLVDNFLLALFLKSLYFTAYDDIAGFCDKNTLKANQIMLMSRIESDLEGWDKPSYINLPLVFALLDEERETNNTKVMVLRKVFFGNGILDLSLLDTFLRNAFYIGSPVGKALDINSAISGTGKLLDRLRTLFTYLSLNIEKKENINFEDDSVDSQKDIKDNDFDVFLCHNSDDKPFIRKIGSQLKETGIKPWLDEWELNPGTPWQMTLEKVIKKIKSAAIFIGKKGMGPWQELEQAAFIREFVKRKCPVIPVILPDCKVEPAVPLFLEGMTWVDFRENDPDPLSQLIWGICGKHIDNSSFTEVNQTVQDQFTLTEDDLSFNITINQEIMPIGKALVSTLRELTIKLDDFRRDLTLKSIIKSFFDEKDGDIRLQFLLDPFSTISSRPEEFSDRDTIVCQGFLGYNENERNKILADLKDIFSEQELLKDVTLLAGRRFPKNFLKFNDISGEFDYYREQCISEMANVAISLKQQSFSPDRLTSIRSIIKEKMFDWFENPR